MSEGHFSGSGLTAPAKLTRRLSVVGVREDGYHLIDAEMVSVDLYDELSFEEGDGLEVVDSVAWLGAAGHAARSGAGGGAIIGPNLVKAALAAVGRAAFVRLTKHIPPGAGLGGGSADAAAVMRWAGCRDLTVAAGIGADVPFCVAGGRAVVRGVGEDVEPLGFQEACVLLVVPHLHVSTRAVYAAWDALGGPSGASGNDLEPAALAVEPRLGWWRDLVATAAGELPRLAGSGGTWWLEGARPRLMEIADSLEAALKRAGATGIVMVANAIPAV